MNKDDYFFAIDDFLRVALVGILLLTLLFLWASSVKGEVLPIGAVANWTERINLSSTNDTLMFNYTGGFAIYNLSNNSTSATFPLNFSSVAQFSNFSYQVNYTPPSINNSCLDNDAIMAAINLSYGYFENLTRFQLVPNIKQYADLQDKYYNETNQLKAACVVQVNDLSNTIMNDKVMLNASYINYNASLTVINMGWTQTKDDLRFSNTLLIIFAFGCFVLLAMVITKMTPPQWFRLLFAQDRIGVQGRQMGKFVQPVQPPPSAPPAAPPGVS